MLVDSYFTAFSPTLSTYDGGSVIVRPLGQLSKITTRCTKFSWTKELSLCHKLNFCNPYIFATWWWKPLIFQTYIIWSNSIRSLKYLRSPTLGCNDIEIFISKDDKIVYNYFFGKLKIKVNRGFPWQTFLAALLMLYRQNWSWGPLVK